MFRFLFTLALIQRNLGLPLENGHIIPEDVELLPTEQIDSESLSKLMENNDHDEIILSEQDNADNEIHYGMSEDSVDEIQNEEVENSEGSVGDSTIEHAEEGIQSELDSEGEIHDETVNKNEDEINDTKQEDPEDEINKNQDFDTEILQNDEKKPEENKSVEKDEVANSEVVCDGNVKCPEEKCSSCTADETENTQDTENEDKSSKVDAQPINETVAPSDEVVILNKTIRLNSSDIMDGKLVLLLHFKMEGDDYEVVSSKLVPSTETNEDTNDDNDNVPGGHDDFIHVAGPVHAHGTVSIGAHYGCGGCGDDTTSNSNNIVYYYPGNFCHQRHRQDYQNPEKYFQQYQYKTPNNYHHCQHCQNSQKNSEPFINLEHHFDNLEHQFDSLEQQFDNFELSFDDLHHSLLGYQGNQAQTSRNCQNLAKNCQMANSDSTSFNPGYYVLNGFVPTHGNVGLGAMY